MTDDLTRSMAQATACPPEVADRLRARLRSRVSDEVVSRNLLAQLPPANTAAVASVHRRVQASRALGPVRRPVWPLAVGATGLLAAALALFAVSTSGPAAPGVARPLIVEPTVAGPSLLPQRTQGLRWGDDELTAQPIPGVSLAWLGEGSVTSQGKRTDVEWGFGRVHVDVEPHAGHQVAVRTREATVQVIGTAFDVERDARGTTVRVDRGHVRVQCADGGLVQLLAGQSTLCKPVRPGAVLGRVLALREAGLPADEVLAAIEPGIRHGDPTDPAVTELLALKVFTLVETGRLAEARGSVQRVLAGPPSDRRLEVEHLWRQVAP